MLALSHTVKPRLGVTQSSLSALFTSNPPAPYTPPPPHPEVLVLNHTTYQRLCITNQSSNCTLYYRTCTVLENRCHHENCIFCYFPIWHVNICNLNDAWTKIPAFNINMGTQKCSSIWNAATFWFQQWMAGCLSSVHMHLQVLLVSSELEMWSHSSLIDRRCCQVKLPAVTVLLT